MTVVTVTSLQTEDRGLWITFLGMDPCLLAALSLAVIDKQRLILYLTQNIPTASHHYALANN